MNRFDVVEILEDVWREEGGHWSCKYKVLSSFNTLAAAQEYHKKLVCDGRKRIPLC